MKTLKIIYLFFTVLVAASTSLNAQIDHIEPPFWWAGMKNPGLQVLVHGNNISGNKVELSYEGVMLKSVSSKICIISKKSQLSVYRSGIV